MPVKRSDGALVKFKYAPNYMIGIDRWKDRFPIAEEIKKEIRTAGITNEIIESDIILDGGSIEVLGNQAIISDRVFRDNSQRDEIEIIKEIKDVLQLRKLIIIPQDPYDLFGHVDGLARFIDEKRVLINDLNGLVDEIEREKSRGKSKNRYLIKILEQWYFSFLMAFENAGLKTEVLPCTAYGTDNSKNKNGLYINFLKLDDLIVMPSFGQKEDTDAEKILSNHYKREVIQINAAKLATEGGLINCVTWNV